MAEQACNLVINQYKYMEDLRQLESFTGKTLAAAQHPCHSPLRLPAWRTALAAHPDQAFRTYVLQGLEYGFRIGFNRGACTLKSAKKQFGVL